MEQKLGRGLGRGLAALFGSEARQEIGEIDNNKNLVDINLLKPNINFRDNTDLKELKESIIHYGILEPILVQKTDNKEYLIIAGHRRWLAAKLANLSQVPISIIRNEIDIKALFLIENINRNNLNSVEIANIVAELSNKYTIEELADILSKSPKYIDNLIKVSKLLPETVKDLIANNKLTMEHGAIIANYLGKEENKGSEVPENYEITAESGVAIDPEAIAELIIKENWTIKQTEKYIKRGIPITPLGNDETDEIAKRISAALQNITTKIAITKSGCKVILSCKTYEELEFIVNKLSRDA